MTEAPARLADVAEVWPVTSSEILHRDHWVVALRADQVQQPGSANTARRVVMEHPGAAIILAVDDDARVICLRQYRHAAGHRFLELPAGLLDGAPDEQPVEVAARELREEVQLGATSWTHLVSTYPSPGVSAEVQHLFLAQGLSAVDRGEFALEHEEADMTTEWVAFDDLHAAVVKGLLTDSPLVIAVLMARARGLL